MLCALESFACDAYLASGLRRGDQAARHTERHSYHRYRYHHNNNNNDDNNNDDNDDNDNKSKREEHSAV